MRIQLVFLRMLVEAVLWVRRSKRAQLSVHAPAKHLEARGTGSEGPEKVLRKSSKSPEKALENL